MYPTLGHFFSALFGTEILFPLPTYGFLLATAFFSAFLVMRLELRRKWKAGLIPASTEKVTIGEPAKPGELFIYAFFGFLLGFKFLGIIVDYSLFAKDVQHYILSLEGNLFGGIVVAGIFVYYIYRKRGKEKMSKPVVKEEEVPPQQQAAAILLIAAVSGIIGAKIFHQLENFREFLQDPIGSLFSAGGLTFYGGLIFGVIAVLWYIRKKNIPPAQMMDVAAPAVMLAYGIGRIGCMASGDGCWGIPNTTPKPEWLAFLPDWMWAFNYPHNVINSGIPIENCAGHYCHVLAEPVWPTPFYESSISILFFAVLMIIRKRIAAPGVLFGIYMMMNGVERFFIEKIRVNNKYSISGFEFTQAEVISVLLFLIGAFIVYWFLKKHKPKKIVQNEILTEQTEL
ncbi:MAG: prolipoprotein diacylglyceryl transferase [Bacteroidales bacterium]